VKPLPSIGRRGAVAHHRNTVAKAYSEFGKSGLIATISGKGCFMAETIHLSSAKSAQHARGRIDAPSLGHLCKWVKRLFCICERVGKNFREEKQVPRGESQGAIMNHDRLSLK